MKLQNYKAIIFDMDGTIIDTDGIWKQAIKEMLAERGIELTAQDSIELQKELAGVALPQSCMLIKQWFELHEDLPKLMQEKSYRANQLYKKHVRFMHGFTDFHAQVNKCNLKTGLATNAQPDTVTITNQVLNLEQFFGNHIYSIAAVNNKAKPDPAIYLHAAEQLEINPEHCIAIEDSSHGLSAAKAAGMFCIGFNSGKNRTLLKDAHHIVDCYTEIILDQLLANLMLP